jgi:hypothetical protein
MAHALKGHCLCGAVTFTAKAEKLAMDACHCGMCRRWAGAPLMTVACTDVKVADESALGIFRSSDWAERSFCKACGTTLFWWTHDRKLITISAQAFDDPAQFAFTDEIYIDEKPANYAFANNTHKMTGAEVVAKFLSDKQHG